MYAKINVAKARLPVTHTSEIVALLISLPAVSYATVALFVARIECA